MKHAYLILAHNEFDLLKILVNTIDDSRNDIFIHFDLKVDTLPMIETNYSNLYLLDNRVDVRWGDVSVVAAEYALFEKARQIDDYAYYHLLSGVDMPLKSQDDIHNFFQANIGKEFIGFSPIDSGDSLDRKVNRFHMFPKNFKYNGTVFDFLRKSVRALVLRAQFLLSIKRNVSIDFRKGTQWISITNEFVDLLLSEKENVLKIYKNTFCPDEIFVQTICWNSSFRENVFSLNDEGIGSQRMIQWGNNVIVDWVESDYDKLIQSNFLFARKFTSRHKEIVTRIANYVNPIIT